MPYDKMSITMDSDFPRWLEKERQIRDWSQSDLARHAKTSRQVISDYENRKRKYYDDAVLVKIAHAFKLPPEVVFEKAGLLPPKPELSIIKRKLAHVAESLPDSDVEMAIAMLEQRSEYYRKNPNAKPAK